MRDLLATVIEHGPLRWSDAPAAWVVVLIVVALAVLVWATYRREMPPPPAWARVGLGSLRFLALLLPLLALFGPYREVVRKAEEKSHLVVLVDTSASMNARDRYGRDVEGKLLDAAYPDAGSRPSQLNLSRFELVARVLSKGLLERLESRFVVHVLAFDEDVRTIAAPEGSGGPGAEGGAVPPAGAASVAERASQALSEARALGGRTEIGAAIRSVWRDFVGREDRRLAGVLLLSDGRDNSESEKPVDAVTSLGKSAEEMHLDAVALGDPRLARNLKVDSVSAKDVVLVKDDVAFQAVLKHTGFPGVDGVEVRLEVDQVVGPDGKDLPTPRPWPPSGDLGPRSKVRVRLGAEGEPTSVLLRAPFDEAGTYDVKVHAILPGDLGSQDAVKADDVKHHVLRVVDQTIRVLVADWNLRHETWFLKNLLVREARREGDPRRFDAQAWIQTFDRDVEQPHGKSVPALKSFPTTRQEIFSYDAIVLGDVNWRTLAGSEEASKGVLKLLREFVAEGGGIAFVAGGDRDPTQYADTPLQDLLPVIVRPSDRERDPPATEPFRLAPTEAGVAHPILSVIPDATPAETEEAWRTRDGWDWYWLYRAQGGLKPGAVALARVGGGLSSPIWREERGDPLVVFATMTYGKGRVFFSAIDQIYRIRKEHRDTYYGAFWDETIRWLATYRLLGGNKRFKIETDKEAYFVGETAAITVRALDSDYQPLGGPTLAGLQVEDPDGRPLLAPDDVAKADPEGGPGVFRAQVRLPQSGPYRIWLDPPTRDGGARAEKRIEAMFATEESKNTVPDHETLKALVALANPASQPGRVVGLWELPSLADSLPPRTTERVLDRHDETLWDTSWTLLAALALLALEWFLRKRLQLI